MKNKPSLLEEVANFAQGMDSRKGCIFGSNLWAKILDKTRCFFIDFMLNLFFPTFLTYLTEIFGQEDDEGRQQQEQIHRFLL